MVPMVGLVLVVAEAVAVQEAGGPGLQVSISTKDGNSITGACGVGVLKLESSVGTAEIKLENVGGIVFEAASTVVRLNDGTLLRGKLSVETWPIKSTVGEFNIKSENIATIQVLGRQAPPPLVKPAATPAPPPGAGPLLAPLKKLEFKTALCALALSADGAKLLALNETEGKLMLIKTETMERSGEIALRPGARLLVPMPDGKTMLAAFHKTIWVIDVPTEKVTASFEIEDVIVRIVPEDVATVKVEGPSERETAVVSLAKKAVIKRVVLSTSRPTLLGQSAFSPDGRFAVHPSGKVNRLGRSFLAAVVPVADLEPHSQAIFLTKAGQVLICMAGNSGLVKYYDTKTWTLQKTSALGVEVIRGVADESTGTLYVVGAPLGPVAVGGVSLQRIGDLLKYKLPD